MSHCNVMKCGGKSGACDCNCRECFAHYASDLWARECDLSKLRASLATVTAERDALKVAKNISDERLSIAEKELLHIASWGGGKDSAWRVPAWANDALNKMAKVKP